MGDYASNSDVIIKIPRGLGTSTTPTTGNIDTWVSDIENQWNLILKVGGYTTPITGIHSVLQMKLQVVKWVVAEVEKVIARGNNEAQALHETVQDDAQTFIQNISDLGEKGTQILDDAEWTAPTEGETFHSLEVDEPDSDFVRDPFVSATDNDGTIPGPDSF